MTYFFNAAKVRYSGSSQCILIRAFTSFGSMLTRAIRRVVSSCGGPSASAKSRQLVSQLLMAVSILSIDPAGAGFVTADNKALRTIDLSSLMGSAIRRHTSKPLWRGQLAKVPVGLRPLTNSEIENEVARQARVVCVYVQICGFSQAVKCFHQEKQFR